MTRAHLTLGLAASLLAVAFIAPQLRGQSNVPDSIPVPPQQVVEVVVHELYQEPQVSEVELPAVATPTPKVDLVIALDTSDSMEALLDSTRAQIWDVVSRAASAEPTPEIRVGLVTFGTQTGSEPGSGNVIVRQDLTTDLDAFYGELMALRTRGKDEYVGWAIDTAVDDLEWSTSEHATHMLIVAGNESALQGPAEHDARSAAVRAAQQGVKVHTMFAGQDHDGRRLAWSDVAQRGGGRYSAVDVQRSTTVTATPFDARLSHLNRRLNDTYVPYGGSGASGMARLKGGDGGAAQLGSLSARVTTKASAAYRNADWDLVDAMDEGADITAIPEADLPEDVAAAPAPERREILEKKKAERDQVKAEIASLAKDRRRWLRTARPAPEPEPTTAASQPAPAAAMDDVLEAMVEETMTDAGMAFAQ